MLEDVFPRREGLSTGRGTLEGQSPEPRGEGPALELGAEIRRYRDGAGIEHIRVFRRPLETGEALWEALDAESGEAPLELLAEEEAALPPADHDRKVEK